MMNINRHQHISFARKKKIENNYCGLAKPLSFKEEVRFYLHEYKKEIALIGGSSLLALMLAVINRKKIATGIKKLLGKDAKKAAEDLSSSIKKGSAKVKLPEPKFSAGASAEELAQEKAAYIKSIWEEFIYVNPPYKPVDKEKNLLGLKALQKYGTIEDLRKLPSDYCISKDSDIMKEYAKLVGEVGESKDALLIWSKVNRNSFKTYSEETMSEIMKSLKKLMVDKAYSGEWKNFDYMHYMDFELMSKHTNPEISENAKAIMQRLEKENRWLLE